MASSAASIIRAALSPASVFSTGTVEAKRLELLHILVPEATTIAVFNNAFVAETETRSKSLADAAKDLGLKLVLFNLSSDGDFETAFAEIVAQKIGALFVSGNPFFVNRREKVVAMAASQKRFQHAMLGVKWRKAVA